MPYWMFKVHESESIKLKCIMATIVLLLSSMILYLFATDHLTLKALKRSDMSTGLLVFVLNACFTSNHQTFEVYSRTDMSWVH